MKRILLGLLLFLIIGKNICLIAEQTRESYDRRLQENKIDTKSPQSRENVFQSIIAGITNFPDFFAAQQSILAKAQQSMINKVDKSEINKLNKMFAAKANQLENIFISRAINAGATPVGATNMAKAARANKLNDNIYGGLTYLTETISCRSSDLYLEGSYCAQNFKENYNPLGLVKLLLENGADANVPAVIETGEKVNVKGTLVKKKVVSMRTPLMIAAEERNLAVVNILLQYGAEVKVPYISYSALDVAQSANIGGRNNEVIKALKNAVQR